MAEKGVPKDLSIYVVDKINALLLAMGFHLGMRDIDWPSDPKQIEYLIKEIEKRRKSSPSAVDLEFA